MTPRVISAGLFSVYRDDLLDPIPGARDFVVAAAPYLPAGDYGRFSPAGAEAA